MSKKIKVLTLGDHPMSPSGVGTQTRYVCEALLKSEKFSILSLGGAIKHTDYTPVGIEPWGQDWRIIPVNGYGTPELVRSIIRNEKPDIVWFMTDPRFYEWLWGIENEIRPLCPLVYYHVWDNYPNPMFNKKFYESNDHIFAISQLTNDVVSNVSPSTPRTYIPHAVRGDLFRPFSQEERRELRENNLHPDDVDKFIVFWNNRNARRKQSGTLIFCWKQFLDKYDLHDKAQLLMHTDPKDIHGQDLEHIADHLGLGNREVMFSTGKVPIENMPVFYNLADATINISDAEGFGLSTLESLSCGRPIIANMTGGLQEQVMCGDETYGVPLFPTSKAVIGSQQVPYIYEDRLSNDQIVSALHSLYSLGDEGRRELGEKGREHVLKNYNFKDFEENWVSEMLKVHKIHGSWETRENYNGITFKEIV
jgi:glycosyltransferase involved in cell wall biosynthesis